jgi:transcriptional antiterminator RfaH
LDRDNGHFLERDDSPDYNPQWYVLKTKPRAERHAASILESRQIGVYLPLLKRQRSFEPLFPGYLFLRMDCQTDDYLRSRSAPGVSYILNADGIPTPVPDDLIEAIRRRLGEENSLSPAERFKQGERVIVTSGPFRDIEAIFDRALTPHGRCQVLLQILGRITRVQVDANNLAKP